VQAVRESLVRIPVELLEGAPRGASDGSLVVGVDGGATKTDAAVLDLDTGAVAMGSAGPTNVDAVGPESAMASLREAVEEALARAGGGAADVAVAVHALAGTGTAALQELVPHELPLGQTFVVNDTVAAWATGTGGAPGVAVISGTGSNVLGVGPQKDVWRAGGWGHVLGDEGSGWQLGRDGIRAALAAREGTAPETPLVDDAAAHFGVPTIEDVAALVYAKPLTKGEVASFASVVSRRAAEGDAASRRVLVDGAAELALRANVVIERIGMRELDVHVAQIGSTWNAGPLYTETFESDVRETAPGARFVRSDLPAVTGSLILAVRAAGGTDHTIDDVALAVERARVVQHPA
jgi:glucosamine kinase